MFLLLLLFDVVVSLTIFSFHRYRYLSLTHVQYETTNQYQINIKATDGGFLVGGVTSAPLSGGGLITINVRDVNEPPFLASFLGGTYAVAEDKTFGFAIGPKLLASDEDVGQSITYAFTNCPSPCLFKIESDGQMKINQAKPLDYETATSHTLKIQVTDNGVPMLSNLVDATVVINVINVNEAPILNTAILTVDENSARNVLVGAPLVFVEPDAAQVHSFTIENGNSANFFTINSASGQISVNQVGLDYETTPTYSLTVKVTDSGDPSLSDTASITIIVNDLNDAPLFGAYVPQLNLEIGENVDKNEKTNLVGSSGATKSYCATDQDSSDVLTFTVDSGNTLGTFRIETDASNPLCFFIMMDSNTPNDLNYEDTTKNSFDLVVRATDNGVGLL